jgi:hypothetical protein
MTAQSTLPTSVNRGQSGVTPLVWQLTHPDNDSLTADIAVQSVRFQVQDASGAPVSAADVLSSLEIRSGGLLHASWQSIAPETVLTVALDVPVILTEGEQRDLPLTVTVASDASVSGFRLQLLDSTVLGAVDANSGQSIPLAATLPWSTLSANILTPSTSIEMLVEETLPARINQGQVDVPAGALTFVLPGAPGESEARITALALGFEADGNAVLASDLFSRVRIRHGTTTLLDLQDMQSETTLLDLPLSIPKVVASGDSVRLDLSCDLLNGAVPNSFSIVLQDSSQIHVRDSNSGTPVPVSPGGGTSFPWIQGPAIIQSPAQLLGAQAIPTAPTGTFPAAQQMPLMDLLLVNQDPPGSSSMQIESLAFEVLDEVGNVLIPTSVVTTARCLNGTTVVAQTSVAMGQIMLLEPTAPISLAPGDSLRLSLQADLSAALIEPWVRFHLPSGALTVHDANDTNLAITTNGLPVSTALIRVVAEATTVGLGPLQDPRANVVPGNVVEDLLAIRIAHPGQQNEADIQVGSLVFKLRDAASQSLATSELIAAASVRWDSVAVAGILEADSLTFALGALPPLAAGEIHDLALDLLIDATSRVSDFRLALESGALRATSGSAQTLPVEATGPFPLPYVSPTIHVGAASLEASFASYPNPFVPSQGPCNITFFLAQDARVTCDIHSLSGERVVRLLDAQPLTGGLHDDITWDGRNERGDLVRNGTYLLRLQVSGGGEVYRKLAVVR